MVPRKLFLLGATGGTGKEVIGQGLEAGHRITAFVRQPAKLPDRHDRLRVIPGVLPESGALLAETMAGHDVVISALGRGQSLNSEDLIGRSVPAILSAMQASGVRRLIFTSAIGVGDAIQDAPLFSKLMVRLLLQDVYADKLVGEQYIRSSETDWTIVQPAQLTDGPLTGRYRTGERLQHRGMPKVSRADVAHFLLSLVDDGPSIGRIIRIGY
jgi:putative NADH-flavin reductase